MFFKQVENTAGKGEIAHFEQFLLFPVFSKDLYWRHIKNQSLFGKGLTRNMLFEYIVVNP